MLDPTNDIKLGGVLGGSQMTLADVMKEVEQFSRDELRQLREYIEKREQRMELRAGTVDMDDLLNALEAIRAG
jgi:hypothetical protein